VRSSDPTLHDRDPVTGFRLHPTIDDPGPRVGQGSDVEIYHNTDGVVAHLNKILGVEHFPDRMRWATPYISPSPDGSKLYIERSIVKPSSAGMIIGGMMTPPVGSTFRIAVGKIGDYFGGVYTSPIPWDANAETVWIHVITAAHAVWEFVNGAGTAILGDPRDYGYPYTPWYQSGYVGDPSPHLPNQAQLVFQDLTEEGTWAEIEYGGGTGYGLSSMGGFWGAGKVHRYLCNPDGSDLTEIDFGDVEFSYFGGWLPDSSGFHGNARSADGLHHYARWAVYNIATNAITFPLDYSSEIGSSGYGPLFTPPFISPNNEKMVWRLSHEDGSAQLLLANIDGSSIVELYSQASDQDEADQDAMFISGSQQGIAWSFDNTKIAVIDSRDQAPVWVINVNTGVRTKAWAGSGWDNPDDQKWLYDLVNFDE
jgi:hypothetical protein